jgi:hypothetical protein
MEFFSSLERYFPEYNQLSSTWGVNTNIIRKSSARTWKRKYGIETNNQINKKIRYVCV